MTRRTRLRKAGRIAVYAVGSVVALAVVLAVLAPIVFQGRNFGWLVERMLPEWRGRAHVGGGHWSWGTVISLARGRPAALDFQDVTVTDPEGTEVLHIANVALRVEVHRQPTRILIHDLVVTDARWRFGRMAGANKVGFLASFEGPPRKVRRRPSKPSKSTISIVGARLEGVDATFDFPTWGLVLRDVHGAAGLGLDGSTFTFEVTEADARSGGRLRILGEKSGIVLPIDRGRIDRVATTADDPDSIRLDASGVAVGRSRIAGNGRFTGIYGLTPASKASGIEYEARIENAADAINAIAAGRGLKDRLRAGGGAAHLRLRFAQPFDHIAIEAEARGLDLASREIDARDVGFHLTTEPMDGRFRLERLSLASPEGGRLQAEARLERMQAEATVTFTRFAARPLLPSALRPFAAGTLNGVLQARADLAGGDAELVRSTLVVTRAEKEKGPAAIALLAGTAARPPPGATVVRLTGVKARDGVLKVPRVTLGMWGGGFSAEGRVALWDPEERRWLGAPRLDLKLQATGLQIERLSGNGFAGGALTFRAHAYGTTDELALDLDFASGSAFTVLGERMRLPARARLRLADSQIVLADFPLGGPGDSQLICAGKIALSGRIALDVGVREFPIARLPGLLDTTLPVAGSISGAVRIVGPPRLPALSGEVMFEDVSYAGRALGGGKIAITPQPKGAIRARGTLVDAIAVDGRLAPRRSGLEGDVTLTLTRLPIEPFLPALPGKVSARGLASGTAVARIAPGERAHAEGRLSELAVSLSPPPARGKAAGTLEVRAENEIVLRARAGEGLTLGPARLRSSLGLIELWGESRGDDVRASLRGRLELGGVASFARPWLDRIAGAMDVDLAASGRGGLDDVSLNGSVAIAAPVSLKLAAMPVEAWVTGGRLRIANNVVTTDALPVIVRAERFPAAAVSKLDARAHVSGRLDGSNARGRFNAHVALDSVDVNVPLVGRKPIRAVGGVVDVTGDAATGRFDVTRIDVPITGEAEALAAAAGAMVDRASVALRVRGSSRQLALSGDVNVVSAHLQAAALRKRGGAGGKAAGGGAASKGPLAAYPEIEAMHLDVNVRSRDGAISVDVNNLPDLRLDVDMHVGGTVKKPSITGAPRGANFWTSFVLALAKLFS
jgi:hypothetical protein